MKTYLFSEDGLPRYLGNFFQLMATMKGGLLFLIFFCCVSSTSLFAACGGGCTDDNDCDATCSLCDPTFHVCTNCCGIEDEGLCNTPCIWVTDECRNSNNAPCGVPEMPQRGRPYLLIAMVVFLGMLPFLYKRFGVKKRSP